MADQASPFILDIKNILYAAVKQSNSWVTEMEIFFKSPKIEGQAFNQTSLREVKNICQGPAKVAVSLIICSMLE